MKIQSIQVKIISAVLLILVIGVSFSLSFALSSQEQNLLDAAQQTLAVNTQVLNLTIRNIMLSGEAPLANRTMNDLRNMPEFLEYEIYRKDGTRAFSDYETLDFVNSFQNRVMFSQTPRSEEGIIDNPGFRTVLQFSTPLARLDENAREMEYFFPILNYADCRSCHGSDHFIRGISHFRISLSDIYEKVSSARQLLTLFFMGVGVFIFFGILLLLRQVIVKPVLLIGSVVSRVGGGDLDVSLHMKQHDELGNLAQRINQMISGLKKTKELELDKTRIEASLKESRKYLDNINEGLLLLNRDMTITGEYSAYLLKLFEKEDISGMPFTDFIFSGTSPAEEEIQEIETFLEILFSNETASMSMIMEINPLDQKEFLLPGEKKIIVHADFQRIEEDDRVQNIMVLFQDMTDILTTREALEIERQIRESELEQIAAILKLGPGVFEDFLKSAKDILAFIDANRNNLQDNEIINKAFRETHSLKGTARYLKFMMIEQHAHQMEDFFSGIRVNGRKEGVESFAELDASIVGIRNELKSIDRIIERFRQFSLGSAGDVSEIDIFRHRLSEMVADLSNDLDKKVKLEFHSDWEKIPGLTRLQPSVFHLIRNAIDHGVEDSFERMALKKPEESILAVSFTRSEDLMIIEVGDDGRGLDFDRIEIAAQEKGLLKPGKHFHSQILRTLFMPGFSSSEKITSISGRGVGLDAVKADTVALNGRINVKTAKGNGTSFILSIPLDRLEADI